jgi:hypothetical protein
MLIRLGVKVFHPGMTNSSNTKSISSQVNYTNRVTIATGKDSVDFAGWVVAWSTQSIPTVVNLGFLDRNRYYFFQAAPSGSKELLGRLCQVKISKYLQYSERWAYSKRKMLDTLNGLQCFRCEHTERISTRLYILCVYQKYFVMLSFVLISNPYSSTLLYSN